MPDPTPPGVPDLAGFRYWKPDAQARALELLKEHEQSQWRPFYCHNPHCDGRPHPQWEFEHARADQRPPKWTTDWLVLLFRGGRGSGKTRAGSEITHRVTARVPRLALIAPTGPDLREIMVEGVSGLLATAPPGQRPLWEPSRKKLTWPNGCIGQGFSAEEPDRLRGPEHGFVWADEPAHWDFVVECWDNMMFGLRIKEGLDGKPLQPKVVATTTPKPTPWMKKLIKAPDTIDHVVSTYANLHNLAPTFRDTIIGRYEGTRQGRQELHGEILEDVEGALWNWDMIHWTPEPPPLHRIVVAVDPAGTANKKSDETGIIVLGIGADKNLYVLADHTGRYSPEQWGRTANNAYDEWSADAIVAEKTYGQDMVRYVLENSGYGGARIIGVNSRRGKELRAEPIVALYEKQRVYHVGQRGDLADLEDEQTSWVPGHGASPNRVDALVHGATELAKNVMPAAIANPRDLLADRPHLRVV